MCNEITNLQLYAWVTADIYCLCFLYVCMYVYRTYISQHEGGVANGHINFTKCSIPH